MKEGWEIKKLGEVCEKIVDGSHNPAKGIEHSEYIMISSQNISEKGLDYTNVRYLNKIDFETENKRTNIKVGDVLLSIVGTIGKVYVYKETDKPITMQRSVAVLKPKPIILSDFLKYFFQANNDNLNRQARGVAQKGIYLKQLSNFVIPIPSRIEQERISEELDLLNGILDKKRQQLKELEGLSQSIFYDMFGDPIANEKGWQIKLLKEISDSKIGITYKPENISEDGFIVLRSSNIQKSYLSFDDIVRVNCHIKEDKFVKDGDILMCTRNGSFRLVGKVAMIHNLDEKMTYGAFMTIIRSKFNYYLFEFFKSKAFRLQLTTAQTATINQITVKMLNEIRIPVPPITLQNEFADKIKSIERQKQLIKASIAETQTLLDSRMDYYFN